MSARDRVLAALLTGAGTGRVRYAPGTVASACAAGILYALDLADLPWWGAFPLACAAGGINVACGGWIERRYRAKDPGEVVIDEFAGQWLALALPLRHSHPLVAYPLGVALFRILDIWKPLGARRLEHLPRGWGILFDDVLSGGYACLILWGVSLLL